MRMPSDLKERLSETIAALEAQGADTNRNQVVNATVYAFTRMTLAEQRAVLRAFRSRDLDEPEEAAAGRAESEAEAVAVVEAAEQVAAKARKERPRRKEGA